MTIVSKSPDVTLAVKARQMVEEAIARRIVTDAIAAGYKLSVHDGEEITLKRSADIAAIMEALGTTDDDSLLFWNEKEGNCGWVRLIYGNDGHDVMADWTVRLDHVLEGARKLSEELETPAVYFSGIIEELAGALKAFEKAVGAGFDADPALWADAHNKSAAALAKAGR